MLQRSIELAAGLFPHDVYVVTGAWHRAVLEQEAKGNLFGASFVYVENWSDGLAASLVTGVEYIECHYDAVLVLLADQVALARSDLEQLLTAFNGNNIACSFYNGKRGVPAIFGRNSFARLKQLSGDQGAKAMLYEPTAPILECPIPNARWDIDSRDQLAVWTGGERTDQRVY